MNMQGLYETIYRAPPSKPRVRSKDKQMKVLALGPGRSGTDSLRAALEQLGYANPYHGWATAGPEGASDCKLWCRLLLRKYTTTTSDGPDCKISAGDFDEILGSSEALTDMPGALFARELIAAYPDAKVVINTRPDLDKWYESMEKTFCVLEDSWFNWYQSWFVVQAFWIRYMWYGLMFPNFYHGGIRRTAKWRYEEHVAMVHGLCHAQGRQVLEWSVADGWEPLCKFLGKPVPDEEFPSGNASPELIKRVGELHQGFSKVANRNAAITAAVLVGLVSALVYAFRSL